MSIITLYIANEYNEDATRKICLNEGNGIELYYKLKEYRDDLQNVCIVTSSFDTFMRIIEKTEIVYETKEAYDHRLELHISDINVFRDICEGSTIDNVFEIWDMIKRELAIDIDTLKNTYNDKEGAEFLEAILVYFSQFVLTTK